VFNLLKPLRDLVRDKRVVVIAPMPGYLVNSCCDEKEHISNRFQRNFRDTLMSKLADLRANLKNFLFMNGYQNMVVLDPAVDLRDRRDEDVWGEDPVHPKEDFYNVLAWSVTVLKAGGHHKRLAEDCADKPAKLQRPRADGEARSTTGGYSARGREHGWHDSYGAGLARGRGGGLHVDLGRPGHGSHGGGQRGRGDHLRRVYFKEYTL
jgi:hypothetical protein